MRCILCFVEKPDGHEHVIPYALGGSFTIDRVCEVCDNRLGNVADDGLIRHVNMEQRRVELRLKGNRGNVPDPIAKAVRRPLVRRGIPKHRIRLERDATDGLFRPYTLPLVEFESTDCENGGKRVELKNFFVDRRDGHLVPSLVRKSLKTCGVEGEDIVTAVCDSIGSSLEDVEERGTFESRIPIWVGGHQLGILKIAYEMAWHWLGDKWLDDPVAVAMREGLRGKIEALAKVNGKIFDDANKILMVGGGDPRLLHAVYMFPGMNKYFIGIRLFDVMSAAFVITDNSSAYTHPGSDAVILKVESRQHDETTFQSLVMGASNSRSR
jgi:hypothetical protein